MSDLEKARERIKELEHQLAESRCELAEAKSAPAPVAPVAPVVPVEHAATANTASPAFDDLPADHPLKGGSALPHIPDVTGPVTDPAVINAPGSATATGSVQQPKR